MIRLEDNIIEKQDKLSDTKRVKEIDVLSLLKKVASRKKEMIIFVSVFFVIGVIVALEQQKN